MQITLNQADIETAISEYVARKVRFEDGVKPIIDLRATRGPEGFTAIIELDRPTEAVPPAGPIHRVAKVPPIPVPRAAVPQAPQAIQASSPAEVMTNAQEPAQDDAGDAQADTPTEATPEAEAGQEEQADGQETPNEAAAEAAPAADAPQTRSLFGKLKAPRNS